MKNRYLIILVLIVYANINAQTKYDKNEHDINQFDQYLNFGLDSTLVFLNHLHQENLKLKQKKWIANSFFLYGKYYYLQQNFTTAIQYLNHSEKWAKSCNDAPTLSYVYNIKGLINYSNGNNAKALEFYQKGLSISDKNNLYKNKAMILLNLGSVYSIEKDSINYLNNLKECIKTARAKKINTILSKAYVNLALYYLNKNPKEAKKLFQLALNESIANKDVKLQLNIHINLSNLYLDENKLQSMLYHLDKAKKLQTILSDSNALFYIYFNYGAYYREKNNSINTINYFLKALQISKTSNIPPDRIIAIYEELAESYENNKQYKEANFYHKKFRTLTDSVFTVEKNKIFNELHTKYEVDKKNLKIDLLHKDNLLIKNRRDFIIYLSLFIFIILVIVLLSYKNKIKFEKIRSIEKQKNYENEIALMNKNKEINEIKAKYEGQNNERNRLSKEIHDGVGASLAGLRLQLSQVNEELKNKQISTINNQLTNVFKELRAISHNLNLNYIEENNLNKLLKELIQNYAIDKSMTIKLNVFPDDALNNINKNLKINLYRIFQELLFNTKKHAKAKNIEISITHHDNFLNIIYEDDGIGFKEHYKKSGIGLHNIKERISLFNGDLNIESIENKGTTVLINIPNNYE